MADLIQEILVALRQFRYEGYWAQVHNAKDLALHLGVEAYTHAYLNLLLFLATSV